MGCQDICRPPCATGDEWEKWLTCRSPPQKVIYQVHRRISPQSEITVRSKSIQIQEVQNHYSYFRSPGRSYDFFREGHGWSNLPCRIPSQSFVVFPSYALAYPTSWFPAMSMVFVSQLLSRPITSTCPPPVTASSTLWPYLSTLSQYRAPGHSNSSLLTTGSPENRLKPRDG